MQLGRMAFIDVETTGGKATSDRITEIAIRIVDYTKIDDVVVSQDAELAAGESSVAAGMTLAWQSLVNPERSIPPFVQRLTGITDAMVQGAPTFAELADHIDDMTQGAIFVAHNARFDYAFFKQSFKRIGRTFTRPVLCTLKLAKVLYPEASGHGLDKLMARHALPAVARHRAMGDVCTMLAFFLFARQDRGVTLFEAAMGAQPQRSALPAALTDAHIRRLPRAAGVYYFYGPNHCLLYVGKSVNVHQRVLSHFSADHASEKEMQLARSVRFVSYRRCAGDLDAQLQEINDIKRMQPIHNRRLRATEAVYSFRLSPDANGYLCPQLEVLDVAKVMAAGGKELSQYVGLYRSKGAAEKARSAWFANNPLCARLLGFDKKTQGACFAHQTGQCQGACVADENVEHYNLRMHIATHTARLRDWPFDEPVVVIERGSAPERAGSSASSVSSDSASVNAVYLVFAWCVLYHLRWPAAFDLPASVKLQCESRALHSARFDADVYRVLQRQFDQASESVEFISLPEFRRRVVGQ